MSHLKEIRRAGRAEAVPTTVALMREHLLEKYGDAVIAILFYGSCLHDVDPASGVVDFYLVVDSYQSVNDRLFAAMVDSIVPPSVHFLQLVENGQEVRAKYGIFSRADFQSGVSPRWFHGYLSARMAQPVVLLYARDPECEEWVYDALAVSVITLASRVVPVMPERFDADQLWGEALKRSYSSELRSEKPGYSEKVIDRDRDYYHQVLAAAVADNKLPVEAVTGSPGKYRSTTGFLARQWCLFNWVLRRVQGKALSVFRLMKGMYTFDGGLDYIAWKLERHSGQKITIPDNVRRAPLLHIWGLFFRLYRQGVFR